MKIDKNTPISLGVVIALASMAVALIGGAITGGVTYGQVDERLKNIEEEQSKRADDAAKLQEIDRQQGIIITKQEKSDEAQEKFENSVTRSLDRILRKLDEE